MKLNPVLAAAIALAASQAWALDTSKLKPTGYVNDFANVIPASTAQAIEAYCTNVERVTGAQIAVVTVNSLEEEPIEDVAARLFREWGIGKKGTDEGILLMLAIQDHKTRAEVGYGLEPIITDGQAGDVLRAMRPVLRQGDYGGAVAAAVQHIADVIAQAKGVVIDGAQQLPQQNRRVEPEIRLPFPIVVLGFIFLMWLLGRGGRGGGTGLLAGMLLGNMMGRRGNWSGGGFGGYDGGGGGGGFGGFGGGGSGGGGASGDW